MIGAIPAAGTGMPHFAEVTQRVTVIQSRIDELLGSAVRPSEAVGRGPASGAATAMTPDASRVAADADPAIVPASTGTPTTVPRQDAQPAWAADLPAAADPWLPALERAADEAGIDPALLASVVRHESGFDPDALSHAGAIGLAQLMPATAEGLGVDPNDPVENLAGGARFLRAQLDRFGSPELAVAAYNAGPARVAQAGGIPRIAETVAYVDAVMTSWKDTR